MTTGHWCRVILVSAGLAHPKKRDHLYARQMLYLNYGLLGLGSRFRAAGHDVRIYHGTYDEPAAFADRLVASADIRNILLLSLPSYHCLPWAATFTRRIKRLLPATRLIAGGRWVVDGNERWLASRLEAVDRFVPGMADDRAVSLVSPNSPADGPGPALPVLDYTLLNEFSEFTPSIEYSRGCGRGCRFCCESHRPTMTIANPVAVAEQLQKTVVVYGEPVNFYMEASIFDPSDSWIETFCEEYRNRGCLSQWRCETRVDALSPTRIEALSQHGMRAVDLGLESGSPRQLRRMAKTRDAKRYLQDAVTFLKACCDCGIMVKVNVMLYPGETPDTIRETEDWLEQYRPYITGISSYPMVIYGPTSAARDFLEELKPLGVTAIPGMLESQGYTYLNLSRSIDHSRALAEAERLSRGFMTAQSYWALKHFNYFRRSYTKSQFFRDIEAIPDEKLPFSRSRKGAAEGNKGDKITKVPGTKFGKSG